jgi:hypothetical protein
MSNECGGSNLSQTSIDDKCGTFPEATAREIKDTLPDVMAQMGIQACRTTTESSDGGVFGKDSSSTSSIGCESLEVVAKKYFETKRLMECTIKENSTCIQNSVVATNTLKIDNRGHMECGSCYGEDDCAGNGFRVVQTNHAQIVSESSVKNMMSEKVKSALSDFTDTVIKHATSKDEQRPDGYLSTSDAEKKVATFTEHLDTIAKSVNWSSTATSAVNEMYTKNTFELINRGTLIASSCYFSQDSSGKLLANNIIGNGLKTVMNAPVTDDDGQKTSLADLLKAMHQYDEKKYPPDPIRVDPATHPTASDGTPTWLIPAVAVTVVVVVVIALILFMVWIVRKWRSEDAGDRDGRMKRFVKKPFGRSRRSQNLESELGDKA